MSVGVLETATELNGGDGVADETIWVDSAGKPWRLNSYAGQYERLTDSGWRAGTPFGPLRKARSIPAPSAPPITSTSVVATADDNTYFIKGDKGEPGATGDKGEQGEQGEKGDPFAGGFPVYAETLVGTRNSVNTTFTTAHAYAPNTVALFYNGLREQPGVGFIESGSQEITITTAPDSLDVVVVDYLMA